MQLIAKKFNELNTVELYEILKARAEIFAIEQGICYQDMDDVDYQSLHCFLTKDARVVAYLRAFYIEGSQDVVKIGRVLTIKHGIGLGKQLITQSLPAIWERMGCSKITMDAQKHAIGFYEKFGFKTVSDEFLEEGIVHVVMDLEKEGQSF